MDGPAAVPILLSWSARRCTAEAIGVAASSAVDSLVRPSSGVQSFRRARTETFLMRWNRKTGPAPSPLGLGVFYD